MTNLRQGLAALRGVRTRGSDWSTALFLIIAAGFFVVLFYGLLGGESARQRYPVAAIGLLLSGACLLLGVLVGFLFGIPRFLQGAVGAGQEPPVDGKDGGAERVRYGANTNLEQISDWLTKILSASASRSSSTSPIIWTVPPPISALPSEGPSTARRWR